MRGVHNCAVGCVDQGGLMEEQTDAVMLKVRKQASPSVLYTGTEIFFQITMENISKVALEQIVFRDVMDLTIPFVMGSVMINQSPAILADPNSGIVLGKLAAGASLTISFRSVTRTGPPLVTSIATVTYATSADRHKLYTARSNAFYFRRFRHDFSRSSSGLVDALASSQAALAQMIDSQRDSVQPVSIMAETTVQQAEKINKTERQMRNAMCRLAKLMENKTVFAKYHLTGYNNRVE